MQWLDVLLLARDETMALARAEARGLAYLWVSSGVPLQICVSAIEPEAFLAAVDAGAHMVSVKEVKGFALANWLELGWLFPCFARNLRLGPLPYQSTFLTLGRRAATGVMSSRGPDTSLSLCIFKCQVEIGNFDSFYSSGRKFTADEVCGLA